MYIAIIIAIFVLTLVILALIEHIRKHFEIKRLRNQINQLEDQLETSLSS